MHIIDLDPKKSEIIQLAALPMGDSGAGLPSSGAAGGSSERGWPLPCAGPAVAAQEGAQLLSALRSSCHCLLEQL